MKAELVPENGDAPIPITRDVTVIGRKDYCDVVVNHHSLSKRHCVVVKTDGLLVIRDLATTNGTKVKGQKIRWAALLPDDRITLGGYKMRVYLGPDDAPGPSERVSARKGKGKGQTVRQVAAPARGTASASASASPSPVPVSEFPPPSPLAVPRVTPDVDGLEILEEDSDDSGWRKLIASKPGGEDMIIELD